MRRSWSGRSAMKRTPVRRKPPSRPSLITTPFAEISSGEPGSENERDTSAWVGTIVPRGRRIVIPDVPTSSAWHSEIRPAKAFLTANTAGVRSAARRSLGTRLLSNIMFSSWPRSGHDAKKTMFKPGLEGLGFLDEEARYVVG